MSVDEKKPSAAAKKAGEVWEKHRPQLSRKALWDRFKEKLWAGEGTEAFKSLGILMLSFLIKKDLSELKAKVEEDKKSREKKTNSESKEETSDETTEDKKEDDNKKTKSAPPAQSTAKALDESKLNAVEKKVLPKLADEYSDIEIQSGLVNLKTQVSNFRKGALNWPRKSTQDWDYKKAGNTEDKMKEGLYRIEATLPPEGYTRDGTDKPPTETRQKLSKIAMSLLVNKQMPLFTGIAMKVDGWEVMMVREIHMHPRDSKASTYLRQPHSGVSYIMKKA